jgi:hypothetical protein
VLDTPTGYGYNPPKRGAGRRLPLPRRRADDGGAGEDGARTYPRTYPRLHKGGRQGEAQEPPEADRGSGEGGAAHDRGGEILRRHTHPDQLLHRRLREGSLPRPSATTWTTV